MTDCFLLQLLSESHANVDFKVEASFVVDRTVGVDTKLRMDHEGGEIFYVSVWSQNDDKDMLEAIRLRPPGTLKLELDNLVSMHQTLTQSELGSVTIFAGRGHL